MINLLKQRSRGKNAVAIVVAVAVVAIIVIAIIVFMLMKGGGPSTTGLKDSNLSAFFPENTMLYAELDISEEKLKSLQDSAGNIFSLERIADSIKEAASNPKETVATIQIIHELNNTLEPKFAVGLWPSSDDVPEPDQVVFAMVVKNKDNIPELMDKLTQGQANFQTKDIEGNSFNVASDQKGGAYIVVDNILMFSDKPETLQVALNQQKSGKANILTSEKSKSILAHLPKERIITVMMNLSNVAKAATEKNLTKGNPDMDAKVKQFTKLIESMSHTGIGVDVENNTVLVTSYTPYDGSLVEEPGLKQIVEKFNSINNKLEAPNLLPEDTFMYMSLSGLGDFFMISTSYLSPEEKSSFAQQGQMVKGITGLDLETDIIPVFSEELTLGARISGKEVEPILILNSKPESIQVLKKLLGTVAAMDPSTTVTEEKLNGKSVSIINTRSLPFKLAMAETDNAIMIGKADTVKTSIEKPAEALKNLNLYKDLSNNVPVNPLFVVYSNTNKLAEASKIIGKNPEQIKQIEDLNKNVEGMVFSIASENGNALVGSASVKIKNE